MAENNVLVREYVIPLRKDWRKVANYKRAGRAVKAIKKFIARHMKIPERDLSKVKIDRYLNNEIWFRGRKKPPAKIRVRAIKENEIVKVSLVNVPEQVKFLIKRHEKRHKQSEEKKEVEKSGEEKAETKSEEKKSEEVKEAEKEKEKSVALVKEAEIKSEVKAAKHTTSKKEESYHRMALQK